jgi:hypothetical protein
MSEKIAVKLRKDFYDSVINKDVEFFENNRTGDLRKRSLLLTFYSFKT